MNPLILAHGYLGFGTLGPFAYFNHVAEMLRQCGIQDVHATDVLPKGSLEERSQELGRQIRQLVPTGKVTVVAHSMGGMDARYLIARGGGRNMIQTLITLGSPFRGTLAADVGADPRKLATLSPANMLAAIASFVGATALRFPFTAAADTHFAIRELRHAVSRLAEGDFGPLASYFSGIFSLNDAALQELTTENCSRIF